MQRNGPFVIPNCMCGIVRMDQDRPMRIYGSGFFFGQADVVATARHIIEERENSRTPFPFGIVPLGMTKIYRPIRCIYHCEQDLAFLVLDEPYPLAQPLRPARESYNGFAYAAFDPGTESFVFERVLEYRTPPAQEHKLSIAHFFEWDRPTNRGNSGGPLIASDGGVAGVLTHVSSQVESADCDHRPDVLEGGSARATWVDPLWDLYLKWKQFPDSMNKVHVPFMD